MFGKIFNYDSAFMHGLSSLGDMLLLNFLFLLGCLPIITIGASTTAMYYVLFRIDRNEEGTIWNMFWRSYRENLRQGIIIEFLFIVVGIILYLDYRIVSTFQASIGMMWCILEIALLVVFSFGLLFVFPLLANFENSILQTIKNAFLISLLHPLHSIWMCVLSMLPVILFLTVPVLFLETGIFWVMLGFSLFARICSKRMKQIFYKYAA